MIWICDFAFLCLYLWIILSAMCNFDISLSFCLLYLVYITLALGLEALLLLNKILVLHIAEQLVFLTFNVGCLCQIIDCIVNIVFYLLQYSEVFLALTEVLRGHHIGTSSSAFKSHVIA